MANDLISRFGYFGIFIILVLGGLGLPVPEEAPIIIAGILSRNGKMSVILALTSCFAGVLVGDFLVYFLGYFYGEKVLSFPLTRKFLTKARETQIKGYFHRHGVKILILGRFAVGFRTAAYLTAGILRLPTLKLFLTDLFAASLSTFLMFGLSYAFATQVEHGFQEAKHYVTPVIGVLLVTWLLYRYIKARNRAGRQVGPPVLISDNEPLPTPETLADSESAVAAPSSETPEVPGPADPVETIVVETEALTIIPEIATVDDCSLAPATEMTAGRQVGPPVLISDNEPLPTPETLADSESAVAAPSSETPEVPGPADPVETIVVETEALTIIPEIATVDDCSLAPATEMTAENPP